MALDLIKSNVASWAEAGYEFPLVIPGTVEETGAFISVRGTESKQVQKYSRKKFQEMQRAEVMAKRKNKETPVKEIEEIEQELVEAAIGRIISWKGITEEGKEIPFTVENAQRILTEHSWIREEVLKESNEIENFRG